MFDIPWNSVNPSQSFLRILAAYKIGARAKKFIEAGDGGLAERRLRRLFAVATIFARPADFARSTSPTERLLPRPGKPR